MENEEILKKAIKKAIDNNFLGLAGNPKIEINVYLSYLNDIPIEPTKKPEKEICIEFEKQLLIIPIEVFKGILNK